jgi:hypothetical protein
LLFSTADEVLEKSFRNAIIGDREITLWVKNRRADHWLP